MTFSNFTQGDFEGDLLFWNSERNKQQLHVLYDLWSIFGVFVYNAVWGFLGNKLDRSWIHYLSHCLIDNRVFSPEDAE